MEVLISTIFTQYLISSRCLIIITDRYNSFDPQLGIPIININMKQNNYSLESDILFNNFGCQDFILNVNNPVSVFQDIETKIKLHKDRFNLRKYVFIPGIQRDENVFNIFKLKEIHYVKDLLVVYEEHESKVHNKKSNKFFDSKENIYSLWTHKYVGLFENNKPYMLDKWFLSNSSFLLNTDMFPDKIKDQKGRVLRTAVFPYEPYVIVELQEDNTYKYMGSEMSTMLAFSQYHNMTLVPVINEFDYWGEIWDNWTGNGLMGNLVEDNADIGGAALYTWEASYKFLDLSKPTVRTGITCLVPAAKLAAGWLTPLYAYAFPTWLAVIATFLVSVLSIYLFETIHLFPEFEGKTLLNSNQYNGKLKFKMFGKALLSVVKSFLTQNITSKEIIEGELGKCLMGFVFMTALILSATYQSGLATIMTLPRYENPINTMDEFVGSNLFWGGTQDAWITSIQQAEEEKFKKVVSRFVAASEKRLRELSLTGEFAFSIERLPQDNYAVGSYIMEDVIQNFHLMNEDFYWEQCVLMTRKNSVLTPYVDIFVLRVFEAGLISFWQNEAATQYMNQYVQKAVKYWFYHQKEHVIVKLKITHLAGAFGLLCGGGILALAAFLTELASYNYFKNKPKLVHLR